MVGSARLILGAHWPSDLIAGAIFGAAWLTTVVIALEQARAVMAERR